MSRNWMLASVSAVAGAVMLMGMPDSACAWLGCDVNSPYKPFCTSGHCGGGDYYVGGWIHRSGRRRACDGNSGCYGATTNTNGLFTNNVNYPINGGPTGPSRPTYIVPPTTTQSKK